MSAKNKWYEIGNGYVNFFFLERDRAAIAKTLFTSDYFGEIANYSVAEEDPETGIMKRTNFGKEIFSHSIRSRDALTNELKRLSRK